ncbi:hypothetical protein SeLEV6574_g02751 [Synchytrium endobioticum]|uniref:EGF-like domain-containing protein n=1 Tax=Synchytrium endobioticum TaxID=286115 RepID=A0A507D7K8_9FUNG|nr:hypothetical protein SeLEV6574_g02751 [Synchytrium endobioticum]
MYRGREAPMEWERPSASTISWLNDASNPVNPTSSHSIKSSSDNAANGDPGRLSTTVFKFGATNTDINTNTSSSATADHALEEASKNIVLARPRKKPVPTQHHRRPNCRRDGNNNNMTRALSALGVHDESDEEEDEHLCRGTKRLRSSDDPKPDDSTYAHDDEWDDHGIGRSRRSVKWDMKKLFMLAQVLKQWVWLAFGCSIMGFVLYGIIKLGLWTMHDFGLKSQEHSTELSHRISECIKQYQANHCGTASQAPLLGEKCLEFETCMHQDPREVRQLHIVAETLAHFLNHFIEPLSYKTIGVIVVLLFCILVALQVVSLCASRFAPTHPQQQAPPMPSTYQQPVYTSPPPQPVFAPAYQIQQQPHSHYAIMTFPSPHSPTPTNFPQFGGKASLEFRPRQFSGSSAGSGIGGIVGAVGRECHHDNHLGAHSYDFGASRTETIIRSRRIEKRDIPQNPLRIHLDYRYLWNDLFNTSSTITNGTEATWGNLTEAQGNITAKLDIVKSWFGNVLNVTAPVAGNLTIDRSWCTSALDGTTLCNATNTSYIERCGVVTIPDDHLSDFKYCTGDASNCTIISGGPGVTADIIIYISSRDSSICVNPTALIHGSHCRMNQFDRPITASLNLCPAFWALLNNTAQGDGWKTSEAVSALIHETTHILAFSTSLFPFYRTQRLIPRTPRDAVTGLPPALNGSFVAANNTIMTVRVRNATVTMIVLPQMMAKARAHFGCMTLNGVELENQGKAISSHLEKRIYGPDYMTDSSVAGVESDYNDFTLAAFEDSGWYTVSYDYAINSLFGFHKGCSFATSPCLSPSNTSSLASVVPIDAGTFCNSSDAILPTCMPGRMAKGVCGLSVDLNGVVPPNMRWFEGLVAPDFVNSTGGIIELMDYCPTYIPTGEFAVNASNSDCRNIFNVADTDAFESFDKSSRCILSSISITNQNATTLDFYKPICYPIICSADITTGLVTYLINLGNISIPCGIGNATIVAPEGLYGNVSCPPIQEVCPSVQQQCPAMCSGHGSCLGPQAPQTCVCKPGWSGIQCDEPSWDFTGIQYPPILITPVLASPIPGVTIELASPKPLFASTTAKTTSRAALFESSNPSPAHLPASLTTTQPTHPTEMAGLETGSAVGSPTLLQLSTTQVTSTPAAVAQDPRVGIVFASPGGDAVLNATSPSPSPTPVTILSTNSEIATRTDVNVDAAATEGAGTIKSMINPATITSRASLARLRQRDVGA